MRRTQLSRSAERAGAEDGSAVAVAYAGGAASAIPHWPAPLSVPSVSSKNLDVMLTGLQHDAGKELAHSLERLGRRIVHEAEGEAVALGLERQHPVALQKAQRQQTHDARVGGALGLVTRKGHPPGELLEAGSHAARDRHAEPGNLLEHLPERRRGEPQGEQRLAGDDRGVVRLLQHDGDVSHDLRRAHSRDLDRLAVAQELKRGLSSDQQEEGIGSIPLPEERLARLELQETCRVDYGGDPFGGIQRAEEQRVREHLRDDSAKLVRHLDGIHERSPSGRGRRPDVQSPFLYSASSRRAPLRMLPIA